MRQLKQVALSTVLLPQNGQGRRVGPLRRYRCALHPPVTPSEPHAFTEGQSITAEGIQGPHAHPNGAYVVDSVNPGTITP